MENKKKQQQQQQHQTKKKTKQNKKTVIVSFRWFADKSLCKMLRRNNQKTSASPNQYIEAYNFSHFFI